MGNVVSNSKLFGEYLNSRGLSYGDVYRWLNENGISKYNDILNNSGVLTEKQVGEYLGERNYHSADNGARTAAQTALDCEVGNIQESLFCIDNPQFKTNDKATNNNVKSDNMITTKKLDLIHISTEREVEFKTSYGKTINDKYNTVIYRHRDGNFEKYIKSGKKMIVYYPYLKKAAVIDKRYYGKSVRVIKTEVDENGKTWDIVSIFTGLLYDYDMMKMGNSEISDKVNRLVKYE